MSLVELRERGLGRSLLRRLLAAAGADAKLLVAGQHFKGMLALRIGSAFCDEVVAWCHILLGLNALLQTGFVVQRQAIRLDTGEFALEKRTDERFGCR